MIRYFTALMNKHNIRYLTATACLFCLSSETEEEEVVGLPGLSLGFRNDRFKCKNIVKIDGFNFYYLSNFTGSIMHFPKIDRFNGTCWTCANDSPGLCVLCKKWTEQHYSLVTWMFDVHWAQHIFVSGVKRIRYALHMYFSKSWIGAGKFS